ncbi:putative endoglucanase [compost metagenome]
MNLSYWVLPAIQHFARLEPDAGWQRLLTDAPRLLAAARFGPHDLPPDWLVLPSHGAPQPAQGWPPRFGFDAVRVPLYFHWGGADAALLEPIRRYWAGSGEPMPAWVDLRDGSVADFPASLGVEAIQAVLDGRELPPAAIVQDDYYAASLYLLSWLARSSPR